MMQCVCVMCVRVCVYWVFTDVYERCDSVSNLRPRLNQFVTSIC